MNAEEYKLLDEVYKNYISFEKEITPIVEGYNPTTEINVLEIGCGTGITTDILLKSRENIKLKTIDIDDETIENMKELYPNNAKIEPLCFDVREFVREQEDKSFDLIVSAFTIHNLTDEDRKPLYKEIYRILKDGGLFINADKFVSDDEEKQIAGLKYRIGTYIEVLLKKEKYDLLKEWAVHYIDDHQPDKLLKPTETQKYFQKIGFKNIKYTQYGKEEEMLGLLTAEK
jgi:ubiquinone/menaquinone biosynthesis C-methylase UbiE